MAKPDLNKLRTEIDTRKRDKGIGVNSGAAPRDAFLNGLLESLNTGRETESSALVKTVDNKVAIKKGENAKLPVNEVVTPTQRQSNNNLSSINMSPERDEQLWAEIENKRKQTLSESMQGYYQPNTNQSVSQNNGIKPQQINEAYLAENVKTIVNDHLVQNLGPIFEEAIKNTILEMYAVERIKEVLTENKEMIKSLVYETIKEIQAKSKAKTQH